MHISKTKLPWNGRPAWRLDDTPNELTKLIPDAIAPRFLPSLVIMFDDGVSELELKDSIQTLADALTKEIFNWNERCKQMLGAGMLSPAELEEFFAETRYTQKWLIYFSETGEFSDIDSKAYAKRARQGISLASNCSNHGLVWKRGNKGVYSTWLATAIRPDGQWKMSADIGHESAHASFSPVPFFRLQSDAFDANSDLRSDERPEDLRKEQLANFLFMASELAVVTVRGEGEDAVTGIPALVFDKYFPDFLAIGHKLLPTFGFDRALEMFSKYDGTVASIEDVFFEIGAPAIRTIIKFRNRLDCFAVPSMNWFKC
jgi:hypothetical protein